MLVLFLKDLHAYHGAFSLHHVGGSERSSRQIPGKYVVPNGRYHSYFLACSKGRGSCKWSSSSEGRSEHRSSEGIGLLGEGMCIYIYTNIYKNLSKSIHICITENYLKYLNIHLKIHSGFRTYLLLNPNLWRRRWAQKLLLQSPRFWEGPTGHES